MKTKPKITAPVNGEDAASQLSVLVDYYGWLGIGLADSVATAVAEIGSEWFE